MAERLSADVIVGAYKTWGRSHHKHFSDTLLKLALAHPRPPKTDYSRMGGLDMTRVLIVDDQPAFLPPTAPAAAHAGLTVGGNSGR